MIRKLALLSATTLPVVAETNSQANGSEPASFLLLVLGLVALLIGTRNLRELRSGRTAPPRAQRRRHKHAATPPTQDD